MEPLVAQQRTCVRAPGGGGGWAGGGAGGGAAAAAALAEERAAASKGGREGRKGARQAGRQAGGQARRSVTEAVEGGESPAAASRCVAARAFGEGSRRVVRGEAGTGGVGAGAWGRGTGRQRGGSLRWCSRCRALLALLPARWAPPGVFLASGAALPAPRGMS